MPEFLFGLVIALFCLQFFYWALFLTGLRKIEPQKNYSKIPPVSIIVCAHDEEQNLRVLIPLLLTQDHPEFEIIVVDDQSNDGTWDLLLAETKKNSRLKMVKVTMKPGHIPGKKFALTLGIKAATHDIVLLTDADCRPAGNSWASIMASRFDDSTDLVLGISPYYSKPGLLNTLIRFESTLTAIFYASLTKLGNPYMGVGRNLAYRKKIFFEGKGFNSHISETGGDDDLFVNQHARPDNTVVVIDKNSLVYSIPSSGLASFFNQNKRHLSAGKRYKALHRLILTPLMAGQSLFIPLAASAIFTEQANMALLLIILRWILIAMVFRTFIKKTGVTFSLLSIPLADILFSFYYLAAAPAALFSRKIVWKT
ncbi:MAG: glycosyltransferase [Cyclobacteriaceae bacterium]